MCRICGTFAAVYSEIALKQVLSIMGLTEMLPPEKLKKLIR